MEDEVLFTSDLFAISPMATRVYLEPGQKYSETIRITNPLIAKNTLHFKVEITPYGVTGVDYNADFKTQTEYSEIMNWITLEQDEGYVEPNSTTSVTYHINVPEDAAPGGQYCTISVRSLASEDAKESGENFAAINDIIELSSIVYGQVSGNITREGKIIDNKIPAISFTNPVTTTLAVENIGNIHQDATVLIRATNAITGKPVILDTSKQNDQNSEDADKQNIIKFNEIVMPESTRYSNYQIEGLPDLGVFKVSQTVSFSGEQSTTEQLVFITPLWFVCLVVAVIVSTIGFIIFLIRKHKKNKMFASF